MVSPMSDVFVFCWTSKSVGQMVTRKTDGFRKIERFSCHALSTSKYLFSLSTVIELFNQYRVKIHTGQRPIGLISFLLT